VIIVKTIKDMQRRADDWRGEGKTIGLVPTMGYLHEGHLSLIREARSDCDVVVVSIFVNPTQFGPNEDLDSYPRDFEGDEAKCRAEGADAVFYPPVEEMYPEGYGTYVNVEGLGEILCGASRPTHFRGVATVCAKLFNCAKPHRAYFGEKDYQQLMVIKKMAADLNLDLEIIGLPTVRESDGLAMSSRNKYLTPEERRRAVALFSSLVTAKKSLEYGETDPRKIEKIVREKLKDAEPCEVDYVEVRDARTLADIDRIDGPVVVATAVKIGSARLIDNMVLWP